MLISAIKLHSPEILNQDINAVCKIINAQWCLPVTVDSNFLDTLYQNISFRPSPKVARLYQVEAKLDMSRNEILEILSEAGYNIPNNPYFSLSYKHLDVIIRAYEKSLRQLFKRSKKKVDFFTEESFLDYVKFFRNFIEDSSKFEPEDIFDQELNSFLIEDWILNRLIGSFDPYEKNSFQFSLLRSLKFKLRKLYLDFRIFIFSTSLSHNFHVFSCDEDSSEKLKISKSFSESLFSWKRKAEVKFYFIKALNYGRHSNFNSKYRSEQLVSS